MTYMLLLNCALKLVEEIILNLMYIIFTVTIMNTHLNIIQPGTELSRGFF